MRDVIESISENLLLFRPLSYRTLMTGPSKGKRASYLEAPILCMLRGEGPMPISVIGKRLYVSKPNMTVIIDKMIAEGYVRRSSHANDRRITLISITKKGSNHIVESKITVKTNIANNLSSLSQADLKVLDGSLHNINHIMIKIHKGR